MRTVRSGRSPVARATSVGSPRLVPSVLTTSREEATVPANQTRKIIGEGEVTTDLDRWMKHSVTEIVRNVGEAPLLVRIYSDGIGSGVSSNTCGVRLVTEKAEPDSWSQITRRWEQGTDIAPNGIILVEELNNAPQQGRYLLSDNSDDSSADMSQNTAATATRLWGLLIQGQGAADGGACYVLKTCRVLSAFGACTHFCLAKADCSSGESAELQMKKVWLQAALSW